MEVSWLPAVVVLSIFFLFLAFGLWIGISLILTGIIAISFFTPLPAGKILAVSIWNTVKNPHPKGAALEHPPIGGTRPCPQRGRAR
jgi:hypothetical protein